MEVILRDDIDTLGSRGQLVKVADGYARNYLLPRRLAVMATDSNRKIVEQERTAHLRRDAKAQDEAAELAKLMHGLTVTVTHKAGEHDQLFGSVTAQNIAEALAKANFTIDRKKIQLDDPIRQLGEYQVHVRLHTNVTVDVAVRVVNEQGELSTARAAAKKPVAAESAASPEDAETE